MLGLVLAGVAQAASLAWPLGSFAGLTQGEPVPAMQVLALAIMAASVRASPKSRQAFVQGLVFTVAWLSATFWWLFVSMHTYGGLAAPLALLAVLALAAGLGLYYAAAMALLWRWRKASPWVYALAFAALWTLAELARGLLLTGFPWGAIGYAHVDSLGWLAPYAGVYGIGALLAYLSASLAATGIDAGQGGSRRPTAALLLVALVLLAPITGRWLSVIAPPLTQPGETLRATLLQGNIPQDEKFQPGSGLPKALDWYSEQIRLTATRQSDPVDLVIAPETAVPLLPSQLDPVYWHKLQHAAAGTQTAIMLGIPLGDFRTGYTNSALSLLPQGATHRYDKHHLVPFGEFIPPLFRWFTELMNIPLGDFRRGQAVQPTLAWAGQRIAPNICYEDLFGEELAAGFADPAQAPTVLVNLSNIAWFGQTVAVDQHRQISRMRSLELQRPMLRATNTGATVAIDHLGRVTHTLPPHTQGTIDVVAQGREGITPYAWWAGRWGQTPWVVLAVIGLGLVWRRTAPRTVKSTF